MKLVLAVVLLFILSCKNTEKNEGLQMTGAYKMLSQSLKSDSTDTTDTHANQLKIYTDDFMMYAHINSPDSISSFGIGSYTLNGDTVTENIIFSASDSTSNSTPAVYKLFIKKTGKSYEQDINGMSGSNGQKFDLKEKYDSVVTASKTPLYGAWRQVARY